MTIATAAVPGLQGGLLEKAQAGDAEAQFQLAEAYEDGNGMPQDDELAAQWYRKSAEQGNAKAENGLGVLYRLGHGVPRDKEEHFAGIGRLQSKVSRKPISMLPFPLTTAMVWLLT